MSKISNTGVDLGDSLIDWLAEYSAEPKDMINQNGGDYYILVANDQTDSEGGQFHFDKVYLPAIYQNLVWVTST